MVPEWFSGPLSMAPTVRSMQLRLSEVSDLPDDKRINERDCQQKKRKSEGKICGKGFHLVLFIFPASQLTD